MATRTISRRAIAVALALASLPCAAQTLEIAAGTNEFGRRGDGTWHQSEYGPYSLSTRPHTLAIGLAGIHDGLRWRAGLQYLGKHSARCVCLSSDEAYRQYKGGRDIGWPESYYRTSGNAYGVYATALPETRISARWSLFAELGIGVFGISNKVTVRNWYPATDAAHTEWGNAQFLKVDNGRRWRVTPIIGLGVRSGDLSIAITARQMSTEGPWYSIAARNTWSLEVRHLIRF